MGGMRVDEQFSASGGASWSAPHEVHVVPERRALDLLVRAQLVRPGPDDVGELHERRVVVTGGATPVPPQARVIGADVVGAVRADPR